MELRLPPLVGFAAMGRPYSRFGFFPARRRRLGPKPSALAVGAAGVGAVSRITGLMLTSGACSGAGRATSVATVRGGLGVSRGELG